MGGNAFRQRAQSLTVETEDLPRADGGKSHSDIPNSALELGGGTLAQLCRSLLVGPWALASFSWSQFPPLYKEGRACGDITCLPS